MTKTTDSDELLTIAEVLSELKGISRATFYRWRATGRGPSSTRLPNGQVRIRRSDLRSWFDSLPS
ncbi:helix-turn-helix transcriptional regulator [Spirillospora albida]|uniref:helix-turn-helix transcriptional regulator n=1 Tax=Spirillospora albida TaxID=58123 RepID=UPI0004BE95D0|nr:helix-turn-helix domain-containing protein [Spirillospora albida]